jgi:hypothetical protein
MFFPFFFLLVFTFLLECLLRLSTFFFHIILFGVEKRNIIGKETTQNIDRINREGKWAKRETWWEGTCRGKREESGGVEKKGDKGGISAIKIVDITITFVHDIERATLSHNSPYEIQDLTVY